MNDLVTVTLLTEVFVTLFVIMDPVGTVPIFLSLTGSRPPEMARRFAWQAVAVSFFVITVFAFFGQPGNLMKSPWPFVAAGKSGKKISSMLPNMARHVDDMAFIHSMTSRTNSTSPVRSA